MRPVSLAEGCVITEGLSYPLRPPAEFYGLSPQEKEAFLQGYLHAFLADNIPPVIGGSKSEEPLL